jgi:hypothetical protein
MHPTGVFTLTSRLMGRFLALSLALTWPVAAIGSTPTTVIKFDLPAGDAAETFKQFSVQAKREILFPVAAVTGVSTNAVQGPLSVRDALARMISSTGLSVVEDAQSGAIMIYFASPPGASEGSCFKPSARLIGAVASRVV